MLRVFVRLRFELLRPVDADFFAVDLAEERFAPSILRLLEVDLPRTAVLRLRALRDREPAALEDDRFADALRDRLEADRFDVLADFARPREPALDRLLEFAVVRVPRVADFFLPVFFPREDFCEALERARPDADRDLALVRPPERLRPPAAAVSRDTSLLKLLL